MKPILLFFFLTCLFCIEIKAQGYCCNDYKSDIEGLYNDCEYSLALTKLNNMLKYCDQCQGIANSWRSRIQQCLNDANASGCPCRSSGSTDTDGDGILDIDDQCDTQQGPASNYGCPVVEVEQDFCPMVYVQGGTFTMGDLFGDGEADEQPTHSVTLSAFYMGKYEVTVSEFEVFVNETGYKTDAEKEGWSYYWDGDSWKKKNGVYWKHDEEGNLRERSKYNYPVIHVSWNDAEAFCEWMSRKYGKTYSLPTEAQWEYAARSGGKKNKYAWGNGLTATNGANVATKNHYNGEIFEGRDSYKYACPVSQSGVNDIGLYGMTGNVWEWCSDWYGTYSSGSQTNPTGISNGSLRVYRGGGWRGDAGYCRASYRNYNSPSYRFNNLGFRLSRTE